MDCHAILQGGAHACARAPPASLGLGAGLGLGLKIDEPSGLRLGVGALLAAAALAAVHAALSAALSLPYRPLAVAALRYAPGADQLSGLGCAAAFATAVASMDVKCASLGHRDPNPNLCLPPVRERTAPVAAAGTCARASARPGRWPSWLGATRCWSRRSRASPSRPTTPTSAVRGAACKRPAPCLATAS